MLVSGCDKLATGKFPHFVNGEVGGGEADIHPIVFLCVQDPRSLLLHGVACACPEDLRHKKEQTNRLLESLVLIHVHMFAPAAAAAVVCLDVVWCRVRRMW